MTIKPKVFECLSSAKKEEEKGKKHKGLLFVGKDDKKAEEYIQKAKVNLDFCEIYKKQRMDYKTLRNSERISGAPKTIGF